MGEGRGEGNSDSGSEIGTKYLRGGKLHIAKSPLYGRILDRICADKSGGNLLDVGSHVGGFLLAARARGFRVAGIEPTLAAARLAREQGRLKVCNTTFERAPVKAASVDVISMLDVIEHLADPVAAVGRAFRLLKKQGLLVIKTPSLGYTRLKLALLDPLRRNVVRWLYLEPGGHLQYFSPSSLSRILGGGGFEVREIGSLPYEPSLDGRLRSVLLNFISPSRPGRYSLLARDMLAIAKKP